MSSKVIETLIFVLSLLGNALIVQKSNDMQLSACLVWSIANLIAIVFLWKKGLKILSLQNIAFMFFNIYGVIVRM